ncbi:MAG: site-specific integrase [Leuconostoc mesenteroides]|jgi:integrase|uniref:site-specific integrase n=1 Tax=Leuconostoc mesenteroides TaxID=1245 RepID=UPI0003D922F9|nr:site-specific integrase [Leuconostoc mesenteroides]MBC9701287.1 site-specific integrase [Leuconostoc sp.]AHF19517.1 integrase [Leuconostoc mesenteroides KFRI-MG]APE77075.1 integrase [Leuconostoc mesenteroides subsp. jonggajibkimchii]ASR69384.1 site-specific integrase [Leuconostoc mesenteroides]AWV38315.1 site-specific integrase [Leuconostoc mesenteroides]
MTQNQTFHAYFKDWMTLYKQGAVRPVTYQKYVITHQHLVKLAPRLKTSKLSRSTYQQLLNDFAQNHERQTVMDFHHHLKSSIIDAMEEDILKRDPTRKIVVKGTVQRLHKPKFLNQFEVQALLKQLNLQDEVNWDYFILLITKTGLRFAEALGLTPADFDFEKQIITIDKTWNYKAVQADFAPTKNNSSVRKVQIDWQTAIRFSVIVRNLPRDEPIFVRGRVYNATVNDRLATLCKQVEIPVISIHGLRHTHASLLLYAGVSVASVARRLGHSNMTTTQKTYIHVIQELENQDNDLVMKHLAQLM